MTGSTLIRDGFTVIEDFSLAGVVQDAPHGPMVAMSDPDAELTVDQMYPELRGLMLRCTLAFFPTRYRDDQPLTPPYDLVPPYATSAIAAAKATGVFDHIEVRTPEWTDDEKTFRHGLYDVLDPIAIGVVDGRYYPIVRWGEELPSPPILLVRGAFRGIRRRLVGGDRMTVWEALGLD